MNFDQVKLDMQAAVNEFSEDFIDKNGHADVGMCGYGKVMVHFGRKKKIKKAFEDAGMLGMKWTSGEYTVDAHLPPEHVQSYEYNTGCASAALKVFSKAVQESPECAGIRIYHHYWID